MRPIVIGDALLRLAEKVVVKQTERIFRRHLMPYQVGVSVPGGLNMWATVVECLLQRDTDNVAATDWPKRIRDLQFLDHDGDPTTM